MSPGDTRQIGLSASRQHEKDNNGNDSEIEKLEKKLEQWYVKKKNTRGPQNISNRGSSPLKNEGQVFATVT